MPVKQEYFDYILGQLSEVPDFTHKKMFGGIGFFRGNTMWGAIMNEGDSLRLKVGDSNRAAYEEAGMEPFFIEKMGRSMPYWTVPEDVVADKTKLAAWVMEAAEVAERGKKKK
ncbi:MAG: TfoX/Sxy family protein [Saprospiraceae bacterium]|nr:TfoX/Sxy family protein [Saprospiraceae bacterium]